MWWFTGFHPDYHHTTDTPEKINYVKMAKILRLAYLSAFRFADAGDCARSSWKILKVHKLPGFEAVHHILIFCLRQIDLGF